MPLNPRIPIALLLALGLVVVAEVLFAQYVQHYEPCELCLRERLPWYALLGLAAVGLARPSWTILLALALVLLVSAGFGAHHAGVEFGWWPGPDACTGTSGADTVDELRRRMLEEQPVRCDRPSWTFLGVSMAGYNFLVSLAAAAFALIAALRIRSQANAR